MANLCTEATNLLKFCMTCSDGLDLPLGVGASDVGCDASEGRIYTWSVEGAIGGLGSGSGVQFQGNWLKGKLLWLFPCFYTTALLLSKAKN